MIDTMRRAIIKRRLRRLVRTAGLNWEDWEIIEARSVRVGDTVLLDRKGPLEVLQIDRLGAHRDWEMVTMNLGNQSAMMGTEISLLARRRTPPPRSRPTPRPLP